MIHTIHTYARIACIGLLFAILLTGCRRSKAVQEEDNTLSVMLNGMSDMNSLEGQPPNSAIIRIYELASETNFRDVTLERFWQDDRAALGPELRGDPRQVLLYPDRAELVEFEPNPETRFIGIAGDLRQPDREGWRQIVPVTNSGGQRIVVQVTRDRLVLDTR